MTTELAPIERAPSLIDFAPGAIYPDVPHEAYHARTLGVVSKGALDRIAKTPAHYRAWVDGAESAETPALAFGRALHARILEPDTFARTYIAEQRHPFRRVTEAQRNAKKPSDETLRAIEYWDAWEIEAAGKIEISADDAAKVEAIRDAVMLHPVAGALFVGGMAEATAVWIDPATGLLCKSRMDYWRPDISVIGDLKTTEDASPAGFARSVAKYRYAVQDAHYAAGAQAAGHDRPAFLFVAVEKEPPYAVAVYQLDREAIARGEELRARDMGLLYDCLQLDTWPSYAPVVSTLSLPAWALKDAA